MRDELEAEQRLVEQALDRLIEHFDTVQIVATRSDGSAGTLCISRGKGNYYARYGALREAVTKTEQMFRESQPEDPLD